MLVKELVEKLSALDPEAEVVVETVRNPKSTRKTFTLEMPCDVRRAKREGLVIIEMAWEET